MAPVTVTPGKQGDVVLLDEHVYPIHFESELSSVRDDRAARGGGG
jgi:hypothetical protein